MGHNTAALFLNDALGNLKTDPNIGEKIHDAIMMSSRPEYRDRGLDFSIGNHANGGMVLSSQHADATQLISVGGNYMRRMYTGYYLDMLDSEKCCKALADALGYRLVKKAAK